MFNFSYAINFVNYSILLSSFYNLGLSPLIYLSFSFSLSTFHFN